MSKVTIESDRSRLRLRWQYQGRRYTLAVGVPDNPTGRAVARQKASQIELDLQAGYFDSTLLKYKPRTIGKTATELTSLELFNRYLQAMRMEKDLAAGSLGRYQGCSYHLQRSLNISAHQITATHAANFTSVLLESVCNRTAKEYLWMLKSSWEWARVKYHIPTENPWTAQIQKIKPDFRQKPKPFTMAEVRAILTGFKGDRYYHHYYPFVAFLFGTGARMGEAAGLKWKHLSDDFQTAWIGESVSRGVRKATKTGKARTILLGASVQTILKERYVAVNPKPDDLVFPAPKGGPINDRNFNKRAWQTVLERLNIPYRKPYATRHTAISHALAKGAHHLQVAEQTGHDPRVLYSSYASVIEARSVFVEFE